jgi:L-fuconolactonase
MEPVLEPDIAICDPHHHLWNHGGGRYLLEELRADAQSGHRVVATVFVECGFGYRSDGPVAFRPVGETESVVATDPSGFVAGIVGFADLCAPEIEDVLAAHVEAGDGRFRGVRYRHAHDPDPIVPISSSMPTPGVLGDDPAFRRGLAALARAGLSLDTWCYHTQLQDVVELARANPDVTIVVDHLGGPIGVGPYRDRRDEVITLWKKRIVELAQHENIVMKLGGVTMPVFGEMWHYFPEETTSEEIAETRGPEIRSCLEAFGPDRCMFESNFPVDKNGCSYRVLWNAFKRVTADLSPSEKSTLFYDTAARVYKIEVPSGSEPS